MRHGGLVIVTLLALGSCGAFRHEVRQPIKLKPEPSPTPTPFVPYLHDPDAPLQVDRP